MPSGEVSSPLHPTSANPPRFSQAAQYQEAVPEPMHSQVNGKGVDGTLIASTVLNSSISSSVPTSSLETHQGFSDAFTSHRVLYA